MFAGSDDGYLRAIDRARGTVVWKFNAGSAVRASPAVASGLVIAATAKGRIFAVAEATARLRWSMQCDSAIPQNLYAYANRWWDFLVSSPVIAGSTVVIGGQDGGVYALNLQTGRRIWRAQTGGRVRATPAISGGRVVVGSYNGRVYAFDLATGREQWTFHTLGDTLDLEKYRYDRRSIQSSPAIADGRVFFGSRDDGLYAIDAATGAQQWRFSHQGSWVVGSPAVAGGRVYVGSSDGNFVQAVEAGSGRELWRFDIFANMLSSPLLLGNAIVLGSAHESDLTGELLALDAGSGACAGGCAWMAP